MLKAERLNMLNEKTYEYGNKTCESFLKPKFEAWYELK